MRIRDWSSDVCSSDLLSGCGLLKETADRLLLHMKGIRARTISELDRANRSIIDHMPIIEALEARDTDLAERLPTEHTLNLAAHIQANVQHPTTVGPRSRHRNARAPARQDTRTRATTPTGINTNSHE